MSFKTRTKTGGKREKEEAIRTFTAYKMKGDAEKRVKI